jgi:hypothetical protein
MPTNQELKASPKQFFKDYSVKASDGIKGATMRAQPNHLGSYYSRVKQKNLVSYLNIEACAKFGRQLAMQAPKGTYTEEQLGTEAANEGADTITVQAYAEKHQDGYVPAFFLPWDTRGGAVEMTIPRKPRDANDETYPRLFLTAAINGCSVFVTGTQASPRIYHCGIGTGTDDAVNKWHNLVKDITGLTDAQLAEVNKTHYVKDGQKDIKGFASTSHAVSFEKVLVKHYEGTEIQIQETFPWGAVFGLCDDAGLWRFYLQENITITYRRQLAAEACKWYQRKPKPRFEDRQVARPISVRKFFPDGGGLVKLVTQYSWNSLRR